MPAVNKNTECPRSNLARRKAGRREKGRDGVCREGGREAVGREEGRAVNGNWFS